MAVFLLSGCVRYDVGVNWQGQYRGQITQHIQLGEQLTSFSQSEAKKWLKTIETRAKALQGRVKRVSEQEVIVTIPFANGQEFGEKFNQFFNPTDQSPQGVELGENSDVVQLNSQVVVNQSNLLLLERDRLILDVDLRALSIFAGEGELIINSGNLLNLEFALNSPWGARNVVHKDDNTPPVRKVNHQLIWQLQPGQINHIEAVFWVPSYLGLGTVVILLLMWGGFYLKYRVLS
ncbi:DUF3153 domain-containing protein [Spirulina subsalsa FACHB-351]|uniref:DUF3153 domain-containing protein n=2 Tax=Spirulina subsalsa TaxID=54311 RepID=A0ABT3L2D8_9CYAN|nr:DUF3153 domain-containing protein [Spirulina subsalsa FACHB-351]